MSTANIPEYKSQIYRHEEAIEKLEIQVASLTQVVETLQEMLTEIIERSEKPKKKGKSLALQEEVEKMLRARAEMEQRAMEAQRKAEEYGRRLGLANYSSQREAQQEAMNRAALSSLQRVGITDTGELSNNNW